MVNVGSFEVTVTFPLAVPAVCGVNPTVKVALWPAVSVMGALIPLRLNPLPLTVTWLMLTLLPPVLVIVSEAVCWLPTLTLPKAWLDGLPLSWPGAIPVPDSGMVSVGFVPFEVRVTLPVAEPVASGAKAIVKVALWPAANVVGVVNPPRLNPGPLAAAWEIVRLVPPVLVIFSETVC
jgi:hypothetical protein